MFKNIYELFFYKVFKNRFLGVPAKIKKERLIFKRFPNYFPILYFNPKYMFSVNLVEIGSVV